MRVIYIAKHHSGGSDDEGAVSFALEQLGHTVVKINEQWAERAAEHTGDFILFHGLHRLDELARLKMPKVCWHFDLISFPDPTLAARCQRRREWAKRATDACTIGFMTDGDHVANDRTGKLHWLPQGADERVIGPHVGAVEPMADILFTGGARGGQKRESFVAEMKARYGTRFTHIEKGVYGRDLAKLIAQHKIVVAPDGPVTDRYASNRVYQATGFGACLLHPWSKAIHDQYSEPLGVAFYHSRKDLHDKIGRYLESSFTLSRVAEIGFLRAKNYHTYRHRCAELIEKVKGVL